MNLNRYTEKAQEAIASAQQIADREHHPQIEPEHLLGTLADTARRRRARRPAQDASRSGADRGRRAARARQAPQGPRRTSQPGLSPRLRAVFNKAEEEIERFKDEFVSTEHLLLAIAAEPGRAPRRRCSRSAA